MAAFNVLLSPVCAGAARLASASMPKSVGQQWQSWQGLGFFALILNPDSDIEQSPCSSHALQHQLREGADTLCEPLEFEKLNPTGCCKRFLQVARVAGTYYIADQTITAQFSQHPGCGRG